MLGAAADPRIRAVVAWAPFSDLRAAGEIYAIFWLLKYPRVELMVSGPDLGRGRHNDRAENFDGRLVEFFGQRQRQE